MKELHLICEAHIDPVWLWEWEEGASAAISTFQSAVNLAQEFDYIFCHNEVTVYKYIEEYAPKLFAEIQELVKLKKWHIMGGWYLQPDCLMPSGESITRQVLEGKKYFKEKFGVEPTTAINFDPFGHSRGLVQIMRRSGQDSYLFVRPFKNQIDLPDILFKWVGYDGSEVNAFRDESYVSAMGKAVEQINERLERLKPYTERDIWLSLWGVGNHGGGPSRKDLGDIKKWMETSDIKIIHSTPEDFFKKVTPTVKYDESLIACQVGCYTSMSSMKRNHIALENSLYSTEKLMTLAEISGIMDYPQDTLQDVTENLLTSEFHDILPGSSIKKGEENGQRMLMHGLHLTEQMRTKAFFKIIGGEPAAKDGEYPIFIYNPHPYKYKTKIECEFNLSDYNRRDEVRSFPHIFDGETEIPCQFTEKDANMPLDWRKRVVFEAELEPMAVKRFSLYIEFKPEMFIDPHDGDEIRFDNGRKQVVISRKTGLLESYKINGKEYLAGGAFKPYLYEDNVDPWGMADFQLHGMGRNPVALPLSDAKSGVFAGRTNTKVVEDGDIVLSVESLFEMPHVGFRVLYVINKNTDDIDIKINILWNERDKMLKVHIPTAFSNPDFVGQQVYGNEKLWQDGRECVAQRYISMGEDSENRLTVVNNCVYGCSANGNEMVISLLRAPAYAAHPIENRNPNVVPDRYVPLIDRGEHEYNFKLTVCPQRAVDRIAQEFSQPPYALNAFPTGNEQKYSTIKVLQSNPNIVMTAFKKGTTINGYLVRLFNGTNEKAETDFTIGTKSVNVKFNPYEVKTLIYTGDSFTVSENLII